MHTKSLAFAIGLSATNVAAELSKPALWSNLDFAHSALSSLPHASVTVGYWSLGDISRTCRDRAISDGVDPKRMRQYTVTIGDCDQPWYVCQETGASPDINQVARDFARVPVRMRQWVNDVSHYVKNGGAYAIGNNIVFFGGSAKTAIMMHETTHCVDGSDGFSSMQSKDQEWVDAYNKDSAVPDNYARSSQAENLAQFPGLIVYDRFTNGALQKQNGVPRIGHQLQKAADQGDWNSAYGGGLYNYNGGLKCTRRWQLSTPVWPATGQPVYGRRQSPEAKAGNVTADSNIFVEAIPEKEYVATNCTIH